MMYAYPVIFFFIGLFVGVVVNILAERIPRKKLFDKAKPHCLCCLSPHPIAKYIPIFGYFILGGRCPSCNEKLSKREPIIEALCGFLFLGVYFVYGIEWYIIPALVFVTTLVIISCIDLDIMEIPNGLVLIILSMGIIMFVSSFFGYGFAIWYEYLIGAFCISVPFLLLGIFTGGVGGGDIKLLFACGLFLAWQNLVIGTVIGVIIGAICSVIMIIINGFGSKSRLPLGPSLSAGMVIALLCGDLIMNAISSLFA